MGADPDSTFDNDDQLVFMAKDAGDAVPVGTPDPLGVVSGTRVELEITDPLTLQRAFVYLFESDGTITPDAGVDQHSL